MSCARSARGHATTMRWVSLCARAPRNVGSPMTMARNPGIRNVVIKNDRVRIRFKHSCLQMIQVLRSALLGMGLLHPVDEDLFERRLHHFEPGDFRRAHRGAQKLLRIGPRM